MIIIGLTGSIGMGKSKAASVLRRFGVAVSDADAVVHRLMAPGGAAVAPVNAAFPGVVRNGAVDRAMLGQLVFGDPAALRRLEKIVHPLVGEDRAEFRRTAASDILVFDIPLLFETGGEAAMDAVACVTVDAETQKQRVLDRGTMTVEQFEQILQKQMPIEEKRARADYVIETDTLEHARAQVEQILAEIRRKMADA